MIFNILAFLGFLFIIFLLINLIIGIKNKKFDLKKYGVISQEEFPYHFSYYMVSGFGYLICFLAILLSNYLNINFLIFGCYIFIFAIIMLLTYPTILLYTGKMYSRKHGGMCDKKDKPIVFYLTVIFQYLFAIFGILVLIFSHNIINFKL